jgi:hypothetical protein
MNQTRLYLFLALGGLEIIEDNAFGIEWEGSGFSEEQMHQMDPEIPRAY